MRECVKEEALNSIAGHFFDLENYRKAMIFVAEGMLYLIRSKNWAEDHIDGYESTLYCIQYEIRKRHEEIQKALDKAFPEEDDDIQNKSR